MIARTIRLVASFLGLVVALAGGAACTRAHAPDAGHESAVATAGSAGPPPTAGALSGYVTVDGSSTVLPVSTAMADAFRKERPGVRMTVHESGTGGGFKKFCAGEIDIAGASRPINAAEVRQCDASHIEFIELPVAFDSLSVVVNGSNTFVDCLTVPELKRMWEPAADGKVTRWNQIRSSFPARPLTLFGPGTESGTFDYFTLAIVGTESSSRADYTKSDDDTVLVSGVAADANASGYFGFAYYLANKDKLKLVSVDNGKGCVVPSTATVADATYRPLSRPIFIYVSASAAARPEVTAFAEFYVAPENARIVDHVGYVPLPTVTLLSVARRLDQRVVGSIFGGRGSVLDVTAEMFQGEDKIKSALVR
jgi:phosphate transport system substrate-binding protein